MRAEWAAEGRSVPPRKEGQAFDSNTITPGTPFMDNLALFLRAFISKKLSTDPGWQGIHVILSDGSVPPLLTMAMLTMCVSTLVSLP